MVPPTTDCNFEMRISSWSLEFPETVGKLTSVRRLIDESGFKILIGQQQLFVNHNFLFGVINCQIEVPWKKALGTRYVHNCHREILTSPSQHAVFSTLLLQF